MAYYCGIDLGAKKSQVCVIDDAQRVLFEGKVANRLETITGIFERYPGSIRSVVESTFNWYWLVDGLQAQGFPVCLAHTPALKAITSAKVKTDRRDAQTLARLLKADMIPEGYIYPVERRPVRDLLRKRWNVVSMRAGEYRGLRLLLYRHGVIDVTLAQIKQFDDDDIAELLKHPLVQLSARQELERIELYSQQIEALEQQIEGHAEANPDYALLQTIPGVGTTIALTLLYEIGDISRFPDVRRFSSYCRVVPGCAESGESRRRGRASKQGNPYLKWALTQAAVKAVQFYPRFEAFFDRQVKRHKGRSAKIVAYSIVAHRIAMAVYAVLTHHQPYSEDKLFPTS